MTTQGRVGSEAGKALNVDQREALTGRALKPYHVLDHHVDLQRQRASDLSQDTIFHVARPFPQACCPSTLLQAPFLPESQKLNFGDGPLGSLGMNEAP